MRLRRATCEDGSTAILMLDITTSKWVNLVDAVKDCGVASTKLNDARNILQFLGLDRPTREAWRKVVKTYAERHRLTSLEPASMLPFEPQSFRDGALYERHLIQAAKGFKRVALANGNALQLFFGQLIAKDIRLPRAVGKSKKPAYYVGNPYTFAADGAEASWPSHCAWYDYELEIALVIGNRISATATRAEVETAIFDHGAFVLINDFSARDTQADELASVGFGFVKSKSAITTMGSQVITADELWAPGDSGALFDSGLNCSVRVNGQIWGRGNTNNQPRVCSLAEFVAFMALDEGLHPGELLGLGTIPNCCGLEVNRWLKPNDQITLTCDHFGTLTNSIGAPPPGSVRFKYIGVDDSNRVSRLYTAAKLLFMAIILPPIAFFLLLSGAIAALFWRGDSPAPGLDAPTMPGGRTAKKAI
uniref:Fumarylacetoacetase-like C-terminal domain-containing protein n=1 Tax=Aureoumbra lagunensis TaxID=44058 RepID=A0A7S3NDB3_9STRA|mmetsp:Transcript_23445/g.30445  ORF Transcript_23445/g.30445 Transcript_23445/m.30445 type:complete len:420 (+) Transcript_23445:211-1470(+)